MEILESNNSLSARFAPDIPELVWATGPISYEYHFANRDLFDEIVGSSWLMDGSLFASDATTLAVEEGELMGIEIGMPGPEFKQRQNGLAPVWKKLLETGGLSSEDLTGVIERSEAASWLNPVVNDDTYYIHALSVKPGFRGKRVGYHLIDNAIQKAKARGFAKLQLDVLSDNPAVDFYRAVGLELLAETRAPKPQAYGVPPEYRMGMTL